MAQYQAFENGITTNAIAPFLQGGFIASNQKTTILSKHGIDHLELGKDYDLQSFLNAFKELGENIGEMNLFLIGKSVMSETEFPPMKDLKEALLSIDVAYHMNHKKNGKVMFDPTTGTMTEGIGHYELVRFDEENKEAIMVCHTPYPSKFEEGILVQITRTFKPEGSLIPKVELDTTKETRRNGGDRCTFRITW